MKLLFEKFSFMKPQETDREFVFFFRGIFGKYQSEKLICCCNFLRFCIFTIERNIIEDFGERFGLEYKQVRTRIINTRRQRVEYQKRVQDRMEIN